MLALTKSQLKAAFEASGKIDSDAGKVLVTVIGSRLPGVKDDGLWHVEPQYRDVKPDETLPVFSLSELLASVPAPEPAKPRKKGEAK